MSNLDDLIKNCKSGLGGDGVQVSIETDGDVLLEEIADCGAPTRVWSLNVEEAGDLYEFLHKWFKEKPDARD